MQARHRAQIETLKPLVSTMLRYFPTGFNRPLRITSVDVSVVAGHQLDAQALALLDGAQQVDLVFADIRLKSEIQAGFMLAQEATKQRADLPVLYTTGQGLTHGMQALFVTNYAFLPKPYTPEQLLMSVTNVLKPT